MQSNPSVAGALVRAHAPFEPAPSIGSAPTTESSQSAAAAEPRHHWPLLHLAGRAVGLLIRVVPRRFRFAAAVRASIALRPLIRRTGAYRAQRRQNVDTIREIALHRVLESMTASGALFDPVMRVEGMEHMEAGMADERGVLLVSPHAMLGTLILRRIYDRGWPQMILAGFPVLYVSGTRAEIPTLRPSPSFLIRVRSRLREGGLVCAMLDRGEGLRRRAVDFDTARGPVQVADALIPLALRCGARVVFLAVRMEGTEVVARLAPPSPASRTADEVTADFVAFVQAHVAAHGAGRAAPPPSNLPAPAPAAAPVASAAPRRRRRRRVAAVS